MLPLVDVGREASAQRRDRTENERNTVGQIRKEDENKKRKTHKKNKT